VADPHEVGRGGTRWQAHTAVGVSGALLLNANTTTETLQLFGTVLHRRGEKMVGSAHGLMLLLTLPSFSCGSAQPAGRPSNTQSFPSMENRLDQSEEKGWHLQLMPSQQKLLQYLPYMMRSKTQLD
jgi:hypothetical protein